MLALSRRVGESIVIDGRIEVMVVSISKSGKVRLGINAPVDMQIHRKEVQDRIDREREGEQSE